MRKILAGLSSVNYDAIVELIAISSITYGCFLYYTPLGFIIGGALVLADSLFRDRIR